MKAIVQYKYGSRDVLERQGIDRRKAEDKEELV